MPGEDSTIGGAAVETVSGDEYSPYGSTVSIEPIGNGDNTSSGIVGSDKPRGVFGGRASRGGGSGQPTAKTETPLVSGVNRPTVEPELKQPPLSSRKAEAVKVPKLDLQTFANVVTVGLFNSIAIATAHEHWLKTHEEVLDFTVPLVAWANQLPPKTIKKIENNLAPMATIVGLYSILAPDLAEEMRLRSADRRRIEAEKSGSKEGTVRPSARDTIMDRGRKRGQAGTEEQSSTIPGYSAASQVDDNYNV